MAFAGRVLDLHEARLAGGALADAEDAAEAFLLEALLVPDRHLDGQALGQFLGGIGERLGEEVARRLVHQRAGRVHGRADQGRPVQDRLAGALSVAKSVRMTTFFTGSLSPSLEDRNSVKE